MNDKIINRQPIEITFTERPTFNITLKMPARGAKGDDGDAGESAYQAWLDLGNVGTEADFIASLKGTPGDPASNIITSVNGRTGVVTGLAEASALTSHTSNTSNPHSVTKAQVGLGNVDNTSDVNKNSAVAILSNKTIDGGTY